METLILNKKERTKLASILFEAEKNYGIRVTIEDYDTKKEINFLLPQDVCNAAALNIECCDDDLKPLGKIIPDTQFWPNEKAAIEKLANELN